MQFSRSSLFLGRRSGLMVMLLVLGLTGLAAAAPAAVGGLPEVEIPDTPAGRQLARFLEALNSGEAGPVRALVTEQFSQPFREMVPLEQHLEILGGLQQESGGLEVLKAETPGEEAAGKPGPWAIAGGAPGVSAFLLRIPAQGYTLVVLMNYGGGDPIFEQLERLVSRVT